jgi:UDPglucose 6-dehydrogenase
MRIGIIGKGFVGSAVEYGFTCEKNLNAEIKVFDINPKLKTHSLEDTINKSDYIFLSLPTPANPDGTIHLDIVDNALAEIDKSLNNDCIILLRSTVVPGTSQLFAKKYPKLQLVFNPEFLTEKNANYDFINQSRIILGGNKHLTEKVATLYNWRFDNSIPIIQTNYETAEFIKYVNNCFLATKVSFMNEMKLIANQIDIDWDKTIEGFTLDPRVGNSHVSVPGHDGKYGFGGSCFPKDMQALINFSESLNIDSKILKAAWDTNLKVRPEKDWETLEGRAVIDND